MLAQITSRLRWLGLLVALAVVIGWGAAPTAAQGTPRDAAAAVTLTLLHNNDGESTLLPISNNAGGTSIQVAGVAAFKTQVGNQIADAQGAGNAVVNVYAGDSYLPSSTLACSLPPAADPAVDPIYDALAQAQIAYTAHIVGNHEFDYGPDFLEQFIREFGQNGDNQPFLSANLDFSGEAGFTDLIDADGLIEQAPVDNRPIGRSMVYTDATTGEQFGIVGATTPALPTISSPGNVTVTPTLEETATAVQAEIDALLAAGVNKIIFVSHLQSTANDEELIAMLTGVDVAVAGGGDEILANPNAGVPVAEQLLPGEGAVQGEYPTIVQDMDGNDVPLVTTAGNYKYVGRIDVMFDADGNVTGIDNDKSYPRRVIPDTPENAAAIAALGVTDAVTPDAGVVSTVNDPVTACLAEFANTDIAFSEVTLELSRSAVRGRESNAGNLVADSFLWAYEAANDTRAAHAIAVQNGGGIRQNAGDSLTGTLTRQNTLDILPFANFLVVLRDVPADVVHAMFEHSGSNWSLGGSGGFLQIAGVSVEYNMAAPDGSTVVNVTLADGTPLVVNGAVVAGAPAVDIVTNSFTADGGDGYAMLANFTPEPLGNSYEFALVNYLTQDTASFPLNANNLPTIQASDARYQPGGEGRIVLTYGDPTDVTLAATGGAVVASPLTLALLATLVALLLVGYVGLRRRA